MKKNRKNRILAFVLAAIMIVGMFPATAFAENQETEVQQISEENNAPDSVQEEEKQTRETTRNLRILPKNGRKRPR